MVSKSTHGYDSGLGDSVRIRKARIDSWLIRAHSALFHSVRMVEFCSVLSHGNFSAELYLQSRAIRQRRRYIQPATFQATRKGTIFACQLKFRNCKKIVTAMSLVANPLGTKIISSRFAYLTWVKISISIVIFMLHITSVSKVVFVYENCQILLTTLVSCLQFNELSFQHGVAEFSKQF